LPRRGRGRAQPHAARGEQGGETAVGGRIPVVALDATQAREEALVGLGQRVLGAFVAEVGAATQGAALAGGAAAADVEGTAPGRFGGRCVGVSGGGEVGLEGGGEQ